METFIVHPENQEQSDALKAVMIALKISFEQENESDYSPEFVAKIQSGRTQIANGETRTVNIDDL